MASKEFVRKMYSQHPYPSKAAGGSLIYDLAGTFATLFDTDRLKGATVVDLGCGTGHRLVGLAEARPETRFIGMDMTEASLDVARRLAHENHVGNVSFIQSDIEPFDVERKTKAALNASAGSWTRMELLSSGCTTRSASTTVS